MQHENIPIRILQFGTGRFLRAFVDTFLQELTDRQQASARVFVVQSTGVERADLFASRHFTYHVAIRGLEHGETVDRQIEVHSVADAAAADFEWPRVLEFAVSPGLAAIVSNVTEAGYALVDGDTSRGLPPESYPAKLLSVLDARRKAGLPGPVILPCELLDRNAKRLKRLVLEQAEREGADDDLMDYVTMECRWCNTLVDRIVTPPKSDEPLADDPLAAVAEPFAAWYIEQLPQKPLPPEAPRLPSIFDVLAAHPAVSCVADVEAYSLRKVRILNGAHTALVAYALPKGFTTVRESISDAHVRSWLEGLLFEEILPAVEDRVEDAESFARAVLERFANPFLEHRLEDIALHHETKLKTRLLPSFEDYKRRFDRTPDRLAAILEGIV
ncbi:MAG: altronate dehydrogenase [Planctomycetota bacterium]|nr:MAG: altronate dehydrogenase [Planctomycetota bacterium]